MELLKDTLDMLVLKTLLFGPLHGYGIAQAIRGEFGSLNPALKRLEMKGWITSKWDTSEMNRQANSTGSPPPAGNISHRIIPSGWNLWTQLQT